MRGTSGKSKIKTSEKDCAKKRRGVSEKGPGHVSSSNAELQRKSGPGQAGGKTKNRLKRTFLGGKKKMG